MFKSFKSPLLCSLALGGALMIGCGREEEQPPATGGTPAQPTTQPGDMDMTPGDMPTTRPEGAAGPGAPGDSDLTGTPGTPTVPGLPTIPGEGEAETAAGRRGGATRPTTLPTGERLPGLPTIPEIDDNK